jgi:hypothetical protein
LPAAVALHDTIAEPESVTFAGVIEPQTRPGEAATPRVTVLLNPLTAVTVSVELADCPTFTGEGEEAIIVKSWTRKMAVVECVREPFVPVTVRV